MDSPVIANSLTAGDKVEILERGEWVGPYKVTSEPGRTRDHVVLQGPYGRFELCSDFPFNIRHAPVQSSEEPVHYLVCRSCGYEREAGIGCGLPCV